MRVHVRGARRQPQKSVEVPFGPDTFPRFRRYHVLTTDAPLNQAMRQREENKIEGRSDLPST